MSRLPTQNELARYGIRYSRRIRAEARAAISPRATMAETLSAAHGWIGHARHGQGGDVRELGRDSAHASLALARALRPFLRALP